MEKSVNESKVGLKNLLIEGNDEIKNFVKQWQYEKSACCFETKSLLKDLEQTISNQKSYPDIFSQTRDTWLVRHFIKGYVFF